MKGDRDGVYNTAAQLRDGAATNNRRCPDGTL